MKNRNKPIPGMDVQCVVFAVGQICAERFFCKLEKSYLTLVLSGETVSAKAGRIHCLMTTGAIPKTGICNYSCFSLLFSLHYC